jgi:hypothetical protein
VAPDEHRRQRERHAEDGAEGEYPANAHAGETLGGRSRPSDPPQRGWLVQKPRFAGTRVAVRMLCRQSPRLRSLWKCRSGSGRRQGRKRASDRENSSANGPRPAPCAARMDTTVGASTESTLA